MRGTFPAYVSLGDWIAEGVFHARTIPLQRVPQPVQTPAAFLLHGVRVPLLRVPFEFPKVLYQGLTMYLLIAIGWHGGEELASLSAIDLQHAAGFMIIGFIVNS